NMKTKPSFFKRNGLSITLLTLMVIFLFGQFITGYKVHNNELLENGVSALAMADYLFSGHFIQATTENWESEFLQMGLYVMLTIKLFQVGSAVSKKIEQPEEVDREPTPGPNAPWPVRKGGIWFKLYSHSLSIAFIVLFLLSFLLHFYGSIVHYNEEHAMKGLPQENWSDYIGSSQFWFESFQNWQSEFLAVFAIVVLSIWLRQKGSPESKPVDSAHSETGS